MNAQHGAKNQLSCFPVQFFATTMGLGGLSLLTFKMAETYGMAFGLAEGLSYLSLGVYVAILALYTLKSLKYPQAILAEWSHPIKISFFPAASISLLILAACFEKISPDFSFVLWATGTFFQFFLSLAIINSWITHERYQITHSTPAWFIPVVGNIIVPLAGIAHGYVEVSWFFFAWGLFFWILLSGVILNRLMFHTPLEQRILPTLFILLAPPSIGFVSYIGMVGRLDSFGHLLYYVAVFFFILLTTRLLSFRKITFSMAWWAYTFPLTAFGAATAWMGTLSGKMAFTYAAVGLYGLCALVIGIISVRTLIGLVRAEICIPEKP